MNKPIVRKLRCAVYTRKSSEEGLDQEFNSLDAQRDACEAYIASQKAEGWCLIPEHYDDGGVSGATLERPALQRLLADIESKRVDVVVVYKIDRLSRALMDFAKLVDVFDRNKVTFVSVTQSFNTTTSMGRLTLNILLSFAQFEREVIGERIRDKFRASRSPWYVDGRSPAARLRRQRPQAGRERSRGGDCPIDIRPVCARSARPPRLARSLAAEGIRTKRQRPIDRGYLYILLNNRTYIGDAVHKGVSYPGEHQPIIARDLWDKVHSILQDSPRKRAANTRGHGHARLAEGAAVRPQRARLHAGLHPTRQEAISLLRLHRRDQTWARGLLNTSSACRGDRASGRRSGTSARLHAGNRRAHVERSSPARRQCHRR